MPVLCKASNTANDVRCTVCGQGFLVYFMPTSPREREQRQAIQQALRDHHMTSNHSSAHPANGFNLPEWGTPQHSTDAPRAGASPWGIR